MRIRSTILAATMSFIPLALHAQTSDTLFARSPWGAEASLGNGNAVSLLRARPSGNALVLSLSANLQHFRDSYGSPTGTITVNNTAATGTLQLGLRHYRGAAALRPYYGFGVSGTYGNLGPAHTLGAGAYGELGAAYFVVPHVSVGVAEALTFDYTRQWVGNPEVEGVKRWAVALENPAVRVTVFF